MGHLSGGEYRLPHGALMLHKADIWGLDSADNTAVAEALEVAAATYRENAASAARAEQIAAATLAQAEEHYRRLKGTSFA